MRRAFAVVLVPLFALAAARGQSPCVDASCFGPPTQDPIVVSGGWTLAAGAVLDFGPRHVILTAGTTWTLQGPVAWNAAKITMSPAATIDFDETVLLNGFVTPDLTIVTVAAGGHDGGADLAGHIDLSADGAAAPLGSGSFVLNAAGPATVGTLDAWCGANCTTTGDVIIVAPSAAVGTVLATCGGAYADSSIIVINVAGDASVGSITASAGYGGDPQTIAVLAGGDLSVGVIAAPDSGGPESQGPSAVTLQAGDALTVAGGVTSGGGWFGGILSATAGGDVAWTGGAVAGGGAGGYASIKSLGGHVVFIGVIAADTTTDTAWAAVEAAGDVHFLGTFSADTTATTTSYYGGGRLVAGGLLRVYAPSSIHANDLTNGYGYVAGLLLAGCKVVVDPGVTVSASGLDGSDFPCPLTIESRDAARLSGSFTNGGGGAIIVRSTVPAAAAIESGGAFAPAPVVAGAPYAPPCLSNDTATLTATASVAPFAVATVAVLSVPNKPLLVLGGLPSHQSIGGFGWTQVAPASALRFADDLGVIGPPISGATDANGAWSFSVVVPPGLSGLSVDFDVYVFDAGARNGLFHQPPAKTTLFL